MFFHVVHTAWECRKKNRTVTSKRCSCGRMLSVGSGGEKERNVHPHVDGTCFFLFFLPGFLLCCSGTRENSFSGASARKQRGPYG